MMHTIYLCQLVDGTQVQAQSPLDSTIIPEEDDDTSDGNPNQSSDGKPKDESGNKYIIISTMHQLNLHVCM